MTRLTVSDAATRTLDCWLDQTQRGQLPLRRLPLCVAGWWHAGAADERAVMAEEINRLRAENARLNRENDILWARAHLTPGERRERILKRLDQGLTNATEQQWRQLDNDLAVMAGRQPNIGSVEAAAPENTSALEGQTDWKEAA